MLKNLTTVKKVGIGFALLTLVLVAAVSLTLWQVARTQAITEELVVQSAPMTEASLRIINGLNNSALQLRGWIASGELIFKAERAEAWSVWIEPAKDNLKKLTDQAGNEDQRKQMKQVESNLAILKKSQQEIEDVARTDKNFPAQVLLDGQGEQKAQEVLSALSGMIDEERSLEATADRKQLLYHLANLRLTQARVLENLQAYLASGSESDRQDYLQQWQHNVKSFDQVEANTPLMMGSQSLQWTRAKNARTELELLGKKIVELRQSDKWDVAMATLRADALPQTRAIRETLEQLIADLIPQNKANREALLNQTALLTKLEWVLMVIGIVLSGTLATLIIRSVQSSIAEVKRSTQDVRTASNEIATGSQQQVTSLNQTATSLNEITTTSEEFKSTMQEFADRARAVQEAANETAKQSAEGRALTQESAARIEQVRVNSQAAGESVLKLAEQMQRIGEITATVNEIADQTKLLALNASIEAARAGEEGRGFAVVATQVRELANQSKEAAGRIEGLISGTQKSMQDVVQKIESGSRLSEESTEIVNRMTIAFEEIAQAIQQTTSAMSQINSGAKQQEMGISELVSSITEIDSASKESLASAEQTRKAIVSIDQQIKRLDQTMSTF